MSLFLTMLAVLPAIVLSVYIFRKDRVEKEPVSLLLILFFLGMISCFPIARVESFLIGIVEVLFRPFGYIDANGTLLVSDSVFYIYNFVKYFLVVALVEEAFKFIILYFVTNNNKNFNCLFDGIIYAVFVSLGFAALENIFYVLENGFANAIMRAVLSVPAHMFFAVLMGYYYTFWHVEKEIVTMEKKLKFDNVMYSGVPEFLPGKNKQNMILIPILAHGLYDFSCTTGTLAGLFVFVLFVVFMYVTCFRKVKKMSVADGYSNYYAKGILLSKYPELYDYIQENL